MITVNDYVIERRPIYQKDIEAITNAIQSKMTGCFDVYLCGSILNKEPVSDLDVVINSTDLNLDDLFLNLKAIIEIAVERNIFIDVVYWDVSIIDHHNSLTPKTVKRIHLGEYFINGKPYFANNFEVTTLAHGMVQTSKVFPTEKQHERLASGYQFEEPMLIYTQT